MLAITSREGAHPLIYLKVFSEKWRFISEQVCCTSHPLFSTSYADKQIDARFTLKWGVNDSADLSQQERFPEVEFSDKDHWWDAMQRFLQLRDEVTARAASVQEARRVFCQHLDDTFAR